MISLCENSNLTGNIHSWELVTAVDGPGTRLVIFFQGCPLRCLYCHNPDTWKMEAGIPTTLGEIEKLLDRYNSVFEATHGGITLSGGEVLAQPKFAEAILRAAKLRNIHTCIDTSGMLGDNASDELLSLVDLVLLDVKSGNEPLYKSVTGGNLQNTIKFGKRLSNAGIPIIARFVLVPNLTDDEMNIKQVNAILHEFKTLQKIDVLPFHQFGHSKWQELDIPYTLSDTPAATADDVEKAKQFLTI